MNVRRPLVSILVVKNDIQQRGVNVQLALYSMKPSLPEFVEEEANAWAGHTDPFGQRLLADV